MKAFSITIMILSLLTGCVDAMAERSQDELLSLFSTYHEKADIDSIMKLFYQKGTPDSMFNNMKEFIEESFGEKIKNVSIRDVTEDEKTALIKGIPYEGKTLTCNLIPLKMVGFEFENKGGLGGLHIGKDTYYFVLYKFR